MKENRLTLIKDLGQRKCGNRNRRFGLFQCSCGNTIEMRMDSYGRTMSCGCLKEEQNKKNLTDKYRFKPKYKYQDRRLYDIWSNMIRRCYIDDNRNYMVKGIKVCKEWEDNFDNFAEWAYGNGYRNNLTIDRIDNNGDYEPSNCRWVDIKTQCNNRDNNITFMYKGEEYTLKELTEIFGLDYGMVHARYYRGERKLEELLRPKSPKEYARNKLNADDVRQIRKLNNRGATATQIHKKFPYVTISSIYNVINQTTWKNI